MTWGRRSGALAVLASAVALGAVAGAACGGDDDGGGAAGVDAGPSPEAGTDTGSSGGGDAGSDAPVGPVDAPFGLDTRPANPTCVAKPRPPRSEATVTLVDAFPSLPALSRPVWMTQAPGDKTKMYVVQQEEPFQTGGSQIKVFANSASVTTASNFLVVPAGELVNGGEGGLLSFVFDPGWAANRTAYLTYTVSSAGGTRVTLARLKSKDGGATLDWASREVLVYSDTFSPAHQGGGLAFGTDGYLYMSIGDGGQSDLAPDPTSLRGKILRVGVGPSGPVTIPPDNPYAGGGGRGEIFAMGFRNPWRFSVDRATGELWVGDVGEQTWEEIDLVVRGGNYGWPAREGTHCYFPPVGCQTAGLIDPVIDYQHPDDGQAVTGGYVYRGSKIPELVGKYLFGDYGSGRIWTIDYDASGVPSKRELYFGAFFLPSFAEDQDGELYVMDLGTGRVMALAYQATPKPDTFPKKLSETGCFDPADPRKPTPGLVPFQPIAELWSDGAEKSRWLALPDGAKITVKADGDFDFPVGTVLAKEFRVGGKRVETRLFMRHDDGDWGGYSYEWNDAETEATLLPAGKTKQVGGQTWTYPNRAQCMQCHTTAAGRSLGPEVQQLNANSVYPATNRRSNQLATLDHIGMFDAPLGDPKAKPALPAPFGRTPDEARARAYLHANCSFCHRPGGGGRGPENFLFATAAKDVGACGATPATGDVGVAGAKLVTPGDPKKSVLSLRMHATDAWRMPPIASRKVDPQGTALIDAWITATTTCP